MEKKKSNPWTKEELEYLKKKYSTGSWKELQENLKHPKNSIRYQANTLGLKRGNLNKENAWLLEEDEILKKMFSSASREDIQKAIPRHSTWNSIELHAVNVLKLSRERKESQSKETKTELLPTPDPKEQVSQRMQHLFGQETLRPYKLPEMNAEKPYVVGSENEPILILNSILNGSLVAKDNEMDVVKNSLRLAQVLGFKKILVSSNLMYIITQRYGTQRPYKTQVSGVKIDPKKVESAYPKTITEDKKFEPVAKRLEKGSPVFLTLKLRLEHSLDLLFKTFTDSNSKPLFGGQVLIAFGKMEDELIMFYANELMRVGLFQSRAHAQHELNECNREYRKKGKSDQEKEKIKQQIKHWKEWLNIWATLSNNADESVDTAKAVVTGYLIRKFEEKIPNSKVISLGDGFLKTGNNSIMATNIKGKNLRDNHQSASLAAKTESFSKGRKTTNIPNVMLGTGLNPYFDTKFVTYQASDEPGDKRMCMIIQLPMCIDSERYRDVIRNQNILRDDITTVVGKSGFESGIVALRWCDCLSLPIISIWTSDFLKNKEIFKDDNSLKKFVKAKKKENKMVYGHKEGCTHYGASDIVLYDSPGDKNGLLKKYHQQVTKEFLLACDAPVLMHQHDGDITQQMNHDYTKNVHLEFLSPEELIKRMQEIKDSKLSESQKLEALVKLAIEQKVRDGVHDWDSQVEGYVRSLEHFREYFLRILKRGKSANLTFNGLFSAITHIAGNHNKNTFKNLPFYVSDARHITMCLRESLLAYLIESGCPELKDMVRREITAPQYGPLGEGRGALCVDGRSCYAMLLKHKQGSMDKTQVRGQRRSQEHFEVGLPIVNLSGDDHKGGIRVTRNVAHIKTGCQQGEGPFGREIDFSEQNVYSIVYGVPVGGFNNGPLVFMVLDYETMRRYAMKPFAIHREKLFENPLE